MSGEPNRPLFLGSYWTNHSEILHSSCLDLSEELLLGSGPKYPEFPKKILEINFSGKIPEINFSGKIPEINFSGICRILVFKVSK